MLIISLTSCDNFLDFRICYAYNTVILYYSVHYDVIVR